MINNNHNNNNSNNNNYYYYYYPLLDRLDNFKMKRKITMKEYLQLPDDYDTRECKSGQKRVIIDLLMWLHLNEKSNLTINSIETGTMGWYRGTKNSGKNEKLGLCCWSRLESNDGSKSSRKSFNSDKIFLKLVKVTKKCLIVDTKEIS